MTLYEELKARGLIAQVTNEEEISKMINEGKATFYIGFDPTADSLHVGHFMALCLMKRLQMAGNKPIALVGGGTGYIGDPSGRTDMRSMMTPETIQHNCDCFKRQMERFIEFGEGKAQMVNNADWLLNLNYVDLLREVGACFSVNNMLRAECYKQRMEKGLSFLEFNYMIMQSYDFYYLFQHYGCNMQFGGNDQWSNMLGGTELIRRKLGKDAHAMTITLLLNSEGKKMGKTASGAVWLDPNKTSPYDFLPVLAQRGRRGRAQVHPYADLPAARADRGDGQVGGRAAQPRQGDPRLRADLARARQGGGRQGHGRGQGHLPRRRRQRGYARDRRWPTRTSADGRIGVLTLLVKCGLASSNGEARKLVQGGGVSLDGEKVADFKLMLDKDRFADGCVIKKGKKTFHKAVLGA